MNDSTAARPVVVGIDGSQAAINAALWAVDEAIHRDVVLRLVHAVRTDGPAAAPTEAFGLEHQYAETALRAAAGVVHNCGSRVKVETDIRYGPVDDVLIDESQRAALLCVGSVGIGPVAHKLFGSTACTLAARAAGPVAVVRGHEHPPTPGRWVVVALDDPAGPRDGADGVVGAAMAEARLRSAPVLALGVWRKGFREPSYAELQDRVAGWRRRYPELLIHPVATRADIAEFLADHTDERAALAVLGEPDADQMAAIIGPHGHPLVRHGECSVLIVR